MTTQTKVRGNKKFDDVNRNNINRGDVNRGITVLFKLYDKQCLWLSKIDLKAPKLLRNFSVFFSREEEGLWVDKSPNILNDMPYETTLHEKKKNIYFLCL